jgi:hypothetical protein
MTKAVLVLVRVFVDGDGLVFAVVAGFDRV